MIIPCISLCLLLNDLIEVQKIICKFRYWTDEVGQTRLLKMNVALVAVALCVSCILLHGHAKILRLNCKKYADFSIALDGLADAGTKLKYLVSKSRRKCVLECISFSSCKSVNYVEIGGHCQLMARRLDESVPNLIALVGFVYLTTDYEDPNVSTVTVCLSVIDV